MHTVGEALQVAVAVLDNLLLVLHDFLLEAVEALEVCQIFLEAVYLEVEQFSLGVVVGPDALELEGVLPLDFLHPELAAVERKLSLVLLVVEQLDF